MILSMTGFGRGVASSDTKKITVEIKSLNSKQLDLLSRIPSYFREYEVELRSEISEKLHRGKIDLGVLVENTVPEGSVKINLPAISDYKAQIEKMSQELDIPLPADWYSVLLRLPDATTTETREVSENDVKALHEALNSAIDALIDFRSKEGAKLLVFFRQRIEEIGSLLNEVEPLENSRVEKIKTKIEEQLAKMTSAEYDPGRLEAELIFYIEKLDVTEEKIRLRAHMNYFLETLEKGEDQGKKLGFIAQEMGREINTLGSKSNNADMQKIVVKMKDQLEQIKEQVLNVL